MSNRDARHLRCGSCGEQALHFIVLDGFDVPACLRHLNHWRTPDFAARRADVVPVAEVLAVLSGLLASTQEGQGHVSDHWRGNDFADGFDAGIEHAVERLRALATRGQS